MGYEISCWARQQIRYLEGEGSTFAKILLMVMSEPTNNQTHLWMGKEETLFMECGIRKRSGVRGLQLLRLAGLISQVKKGNQYQSTTYELHTDIYLNESAILALAPKVNTPDMQVNTPDMQVNTPETTSEHARYASEHARNDSHIEEGTVSTVTEPSLEPFNRMRATENEKQRNGETPEFEFWGTVTAIVEQQMTRPSYKTWLKDTRCISFTGDIVVIEVANTFVRDTLRDRMYSMIDQAARQISPDIKEILFEVAQATEDS